MPNSIIAGLNAVKAALTYEAEQIEKLHFDASSRNPRLLELIQKARQQNITAQASSRTELDRLSSGVRHQGIVVESTSHAVSFQEEDLPGIVDAHWPPLLLILDGVQDPHNLGACLRTAAAAGVAAVVAPSDRAVGLNATVRKVASGGAEVVPFIQVTNLARTLRLLQQRGVWLIGAAGDAAGSLYDTDLKGPLALVLGAEDKGLRRLTREHCDVLVRIPINTHIESLNVSVATGVLLFEAQRQRQ